MENPLLKKLLIKPGMSLQVINEPDAVAQLLGPVPAAPSPADSPAKNAVLLFATNATELAQQLQHTVPSLQPDTVFWIIFPKKNKGIPTDLEAMTSWAVLEPYGLRIVSSAAINEVWTAVRIRPKALTKASGMCLEDIARNEYGKFIDVQQRTVTLPGDVAAALKQDAAALAVYEKLSFSHRKEYIIWVLSARQEKTRISRVQKMIEKLSAGRKNPADK